LEPVPLDDKSADCALKLRDAALLFFSIVVAGVFALEELAHALLELLLSLQDLYGVDLVLGGDLMDRLNAFQRFKRDASFELGAVVAALAFHGFHGACSADGRGT
jgi:hypothetical protein